MFDRSTWRTNVGKRLDAFARNPRQEIFISSGSVSLLTYLAACTLEPFLAAYEKEPITAIHTLSSISQVPEMNVLVRRIPSMRFQVARVLQQELRSSSEWRLAVEELLVGIDTIHLARQRLHGLDADWFQEMLRVEVAQAPPNEFIQLRRRLKDTWKSFQGIFQEMRQRKGKYTQEELILLYVGLSDSSAGVRAQAARRLGEYAWTPSENMISRLIQVALHDNDLEPRNAASRALGALRDRIRAPHLINDLVRYLQDEDTFVRTATAMALANLGELAGTDIIVESLVRLLRDEDPYTREAAAHALGNMGVNAARGKVIAALTRALEDDNEEVHTAALESLTRLRELREMHVPSQKKSGATTTPLTENLQATRNAPETVELPESRQHEREQADPNAPTPNLGTRGRRDETSELLSPATAR
ncbi:MAG: HEAT repeat domain-containing protein [Chloroflexaceae bacterium]|nr:HEAT repeat domain-containing protein [Chloroflexaceae bacterium]